ncbi:MAG: beta-propeller fold lactonase family protein [Verrucomicrobiota bacterium]
MIRILLSLLLLLSGFGALAAESFYVFAPDQKGQEVMGLSVRAGSDGVAVEKLEGLELPFGPSSCAIHPNGRHLIFSAGGRGEPRAASIEVLGDGELRLVGVSPLGGPTGYTSVDRTGRFFLSANYRNGAVNVYRLDEANRVGDQVCSLKTPRTEAHCLRTTPDNRFAYVPCVKNNNALYQYSFDEQTGKLTPLEPFDAEPPVLFGPRHVAYHPTLPMAYFSYEQQLGVGVYTIGDHGQLVARQHAATLPRMEPYEKGKRGLSASDIVLSPDGKRLFVAIRDFVGEEDSVFSFRVEEDGRLSQIARTQVGDIPWKLDLSPHGRHLLVSESGENRLSIFKVAPDGALTRAAEVDWGVRVRDLVVATPRTGQ